MVMRWPANGATTLPCMHSIVLANVLFRLAKDLASVAKGSVEMRVERKVKAIQVGR